MATITESVKESLVGTDLAPELSQQSRATFLKHCRTDENGERYLAEEDFVDAIAPASEDYVCLPFAVMIIECVIVRG